MTLARWFAGSFERDYSRGYMRKGRVRVLGCVAQKGIFLKKDSFLTFIFFKIKKKNYELEG